MIIFNKENPLKFEEMINQVICGDCLDVLNCVPDNSIKCLITSPPYNMGGASLGYKPNAKYGHKYYDKYNDNLSEQKYEDFIYQCLELFIKKSVYVFFNIQFLTSTKRVCAGIQNRFFDNLKEIFIWKKVSMAQIKHPLKKSYRMATGFEFVFIFGKDNTREFSDVNFPKNGYVENIKEWFKSEYFDDHAATFPKELPSFFIQHFSFPGEIICDPFSGTHTTALAAKELGRKFIGIEISDKYCARAKRRLAQEYLFT